MLQRMTRSVITLLAVALFTVLVLAGCSLQSIIPEHAPPNSTKVLASYPNATNPVLSEKTRNPDLPWRILTFTTDDTPDQVLGFYENLLQNEGWNQEASSTDSRIFNWGIGMKDSAIWNITVVTLKRLHEPTEVKVELRANGRL